MEAREQFDLELTRMQASSFSDDAKYSVEAYGFRHYGCWVVRRDRLGAGMLLTFSYESRKGVH